MPVSSVFYNVAQVGRKLFDTEQFITAAEAFHPKVAFTTERKPGGRTIILTDLPQDYVVELDGRVLSVSLHAATGMAAYAKINALEYALISTFAGILLGDALRDSEYLTLESFFHEFDPPCLLSHSLKQSTMGQLLDSLYVCPRCACFYRQLGAETSFSALKEVLDYVEAHRIARSLNRRRTGSARN